MRSRKVWGTKHTSIHTLERPLVRSLVQRPAIQINIISGYFGIHTLPKFQQRNIILIICRRTVLNTSPVCCLYLRWSARIPFFSRCRSPLRLHFLIIVFVSWRSFCLSSDTTTSTQRRIEQIIATNHNMVVD